MSVIFALWLREVRRYARSPVQVAASLGQPLLYIISLGFGMGRVFQQAGQGSYLQYLAPGVISMSLLFTAVFSCSGLLLLDRHMGFLKMTLVAPVPRIQIMIGRLLGGTTMAVLQSTLVTILCLLAGFRVNDLTRLPLAYLIMALIAFVFAGFGIIVGSLVQDMQAFQLVMNFLTVPIFFLSGALFPLENLPLPLTIATALDPLAYGVDALRGALIGSSHFGTALDISVLIVLAVLFVMIGQFLFARLSA